MTEAETQERDAEETTTEEQEAPSEDNLLDDAIEKAFEEQSESEPAEQEEPEEPAETPEQEEEITTPEHWPEEIKAQYAEIKDEAARSLVMEMSKKLEAAHTKNSQELAGQRGEIKEALAPVEAVMQQQGLSEGAAVKALVQQHQQIQPWLHGLQTNPRETILQLAQSYNVDLGAPSEDEFLDPDTKALKEQISMLQGEINGLKTQGQTAQQQAVQQEIQAFYNTKDEEGNPAYPHFQSVQQQMSSLLQSGLANSLKDAYEQAVLLNPEIREKLEQEKIEARLKEEKARHDEELAKAKKAKRRLTGNGPAQKATKASTIDEAINAAWEEHAGAA